MVKKSIIGVGVITAAMALSVVVTPLAMTSEASAAIMYKCKIYNWFIGWRTVYTTDWRYYQERGWQCYCIPS